MKCVSCLEIVESNPRATPKQLFQSGKVGDVTVIYNGTGYCRDCYFNNKRLGLLK